MAGGGPDPHDQAHGAYGLPEGTHLLSALLGVRGVDVAMPTQGDQVLGATVLAELPQRLFRLSLDDDTTLIAGLSTEAKRLGLPINVGMRVTVRRARLDPARGTILGPQSSHPLDPVSNPRQ